MATDIAAKRATERAPGLTANAEAQSVMSGMMPAMLIFVFPLMEKKVSGHLKLRVSSLCWAPASSTKDQLR